MARLLIEGGPYSYERQATNTRADRVFTNAAVSRGYTGDTEDKQAVLDFIGQELVDWLVANAKAQEQRDAVDQAVADVDENPPEWNDR